MLAEDAVDNERLEDDEDDGEDGTARARNDAEETNEPAQEALDENGEDEEVSCGQ